MSTPTTAPDRYADTPLDEWLRRQLWTKYDLPQVVIFEPSKTIYDAWTVVERMSDFQWHLTLSYYSGGVSAKFWQIGRGKLGEASGTTKDAAWAISMAAKRALTPK